MQDDIPSLNPYSGGKCIPMVNLEPENEASQRLNPYSGGKCIPIF